MTTGIWILGDQLSQQQAALVKQTNSPIIFIESRDWVRLRPYHAQKLVLVWAAMRHFAEELRSLGYGVTYCQAEDFATPLREWIESHQLTEVRLLTPSDHSFLVYLKNLSLPCRLTLVPNNLFLWSSSEFQAWAQPRKRLLLEDFYRAGRKRWQILVENGQPLGGKWNYDHDNRQPPQKNSTFLESLRFSPDALTTQVITEVKNLAIPTYGQITPFYWGVTRTQALLVLEDFLTQRLPFFGPYQDAMLSREETLWHSLLSPYLNLGLLHPLEVIQRALEVHDETPLPLNSLEGFIRQILGWREYMYGLYHLVEESYFSSNWFAHAQPLPAFYWDSAQTQMNCLKKVLQQVERTGYAHHIQRLMILSNFALISGVNPQELENWFHIVIIDAYDWVMQTNVLGMGQFADGGKLASKPYAASANYINRMSDYCQGCRYNPKSRTGADACPFNFFYWDFLSRHQDKLASQGRMNLILANLRKLDSQELAAIQTLAREYQEEELALRGNPE
jgi:deoxyribodipyrimidine photolyase-related protein